MLDDDIKWKFQILIQNIDSVIHEIEYDRKSADDRSTKNIQDMEKIRGYWFAGIGVFITLSASYLFTRDFNQWQLLWIIIPALIAFAIFFLTNLFIARLKEVLQDIDDSYYNFNKLHLIPLKGMLSGYALSDQFSKENMDLTISYVKSYTRAISYLFGKYINERLDTIVFELTGFGSFYDEAKAKLDEYKNFNYGMGIEVINEFVKEYEKKPKRKKR